MKKQIIIGLFSGALVLLASCTEHDYNHDNLSDKPIVFAPTVSATDWNAGEETRGTLFTATSFPNDAVFGVSAYRYDGTTLTAATATANFMYKTAISRTMEKWRTTEPYYWPADGDRLDFYAYYPYDNNNVVPKSQSTPGPMQIQYTVNSNPLNQVDLLTAHAKNCTFDNSSAQTLNFTHQLTAINLVLGANVAPGYIKSISFENIATQGTLTVGTGWSEKNNATFTLDMKAYYDSTNGYKTTDSNDNIVTGDAANITATTTTLLMIPQTFTSTNQKLKIVFANEDHPDGIELTKTLTDVWAAGGTLTYQISTSSINVLKIAAINYPAPSTWGNAYIRSDYNNGDEVGLYAIDAQGNVQVDNLKLTRTGGKWVDSNNSTPLYSPGLTWFMYHPWKNGGLAHSGKKGGVVVTTADDFFEDGVSNWTINPDQHLQNDFLAQDLQIATGVQTKASTLRFDMAHKMGILHLTIDPTGDAGDMVYYDGNEGANSTTVVSSTGMHTYTPSRTFITNKPYNVPNTNFFLYIGHPGSLTMSASHTNKYDAWDADANTASITKTLVANSYVAHNVVNKYGNRGYVQRGWVYSYSGRAKNFTAPAAGTYKFECWGAQGAEGKTHEELGTIPGGKGAYTSGNLVVSQNATFYVYVGGSPAKMTFPGGWNGGGNGTTNESRPDYTSFQIGYGGGGATDIRITPASTTDNTVWNNTTSLRTRIMVAGAGAGSTAVPQKMTPGSGGGLLGNDGYDETWSYSSDSKNRASGEVGKSYKWYNYQTKTWSTFTWTSTMTSLPAVYCATGGTQTTGGNSSNWHEPTIYYGNTAAEGNTAFMAKSGINLGGFGYGGENHQIAKYTNANNSVTDIIAYGSAGGGGGWYGGGAANRNHGGSGGGSSFISGHPGCNAINSSGTHLGASTTMTIGNKNYQFTNTVMIDGAGLEWTTANQIIGGNYVGVPSTTGGAAEAGHSGHGYARITETFVED